MKSHARSALLILLVVVLATGLTACWGKKREMLNGNVEAVLRDCPPVDIVFVMDTSGSMDDEALALCNAISGVEQDLLNRGLSSIRTTLLGITDSGGGDPDFSCLTDSVLSFVGSVVPGSGDPLDQYEDWAPATAIVADGFNWTPGAIRIIVPISDEGPENGDPYDSADDDAVANAISFAQAGNVILSPIIASEDGQDPRIQAAGQQMADLTGGTLTLSTNAESQFSAAIFDLIVAACGSYVPPVD